MTLLITLCVFQTIFNLGMIDSLFEHRIREKQQHFFIGVGRSQRFQSLAKYIMEQSWRHPIMSHVSPA